jgi:hypothetical protein
MQNSEEYLFKSVITLLEHTFPLFVFQSSDSSAMIYLGKHKTFYLEFKL